MPETHDQEARTELAKYFSLIGSSQPPGDLPMPAGLIDETWHNLMKQEAEYDRFCMDQVGFVVGHESGGGRKEIPWVKSYEERFGRLSKLWFTSKDGVFDSKSYGDYLSTGTYIASWDCGPVVPEMVKRINNDIERLKKVREINDKIDDLGGIIPDLDSINVVDEDDLIESIKKKIDKFNIDRIKERHSIN
jgi:hypothetical protein